MSSLAIRSGEPACRAGTPLPAAAFAEVRSRAVFDCCKWDPQVEDVATLAPFPVLLSPDTWRELSTLAEGLAREALAAEAELLGRPDLHRDLALPAAAIRALKRAGDEDPSPGIARLIRFDFHLTPDGWRISEANTDVPGGLNEASGYSALVVQHYPGAVTVGDPGAAYLDALLAGLPSRAPRIGLVHATAYSDDHQVMRYLAERLASRGTAASAVLVSPAHLRWNDGHAHVASDGWSGPVDILVRFFPAEWLPQLPASSGWRHWFAGARTPASNPAAALLTQSKRFPLVWDALRTPLPTWRALLPETRDPRDAPWRRAGKEEWVLKPALGRVGEGVGIRGVTTAAEWRKISRDLFWHPRHWVAQRRFEAAPLTVPGDADRYGCIGVYTVDTTAVGAYGRVARRPIVDSRAQDAAVLVESGVTC
jgi:glutathionylspermidine synthase